MTTATRTRAMLAARANDSQDKRHRALEAIRSLEAAGTPVTATAVATAAGVSTWLVYAGGVREHVQAARQRQAQQDQVPVAAAPAGIEPVTQTSLRTDLTIARQEIRQLRAERDKLRGRLRLQLGAEIEGPEKAELITRISQLEEAARRLAAERDARTTEASHAQHRIGELEDELTAARESLRRVIRDANR
jgi:chromosome segregation ATPase